MLRPMTNCLPRMRIAVVTAWRMTGSPTRETRRFSVPPRFFSSPSRWTMRPVSISAQVPALTKVLCEAPSRLAHSVLPILSRISRSTVSVSGMRSSASAMHISTTPSREDRS